MQQVKEQDLEYRDGDHGVKYLFRGPNIDWGVIRLKPGGALGGHYHERVEETFYFTSGSAKAVVNGEDHRARAGDAFRMEPGDRHDIVNDADEDCDMVFIKFPFDKKDKIPL